MLNKEKIIYRSFVKQIKKDSKMKCYPANIEVNTVASIPLEVLVNHNTKWLLESIHLHTKDFEDFIHFDLHFKWGCDGSSGHSEYHQKYSIKSANEKKQQIYVESNRELDIENKDVDETKTNEKWDANLFLFYFVHLKLLG